MKADMKRRLRDATDDKMFDEDWEAENNTELLPPGPGTNRYTDDARLWNSTTFDWNLLSLKQEFKVCF